MWWPHGGLGAQFCTRVIRVNIRFSVVITVICLQQWLSQFSTQSGSKLEAVNLEVINEREGSKPFSFREWQQHKKGQANSLFLVKPALTQMYSTENNFFK